MKNQVKAVIIKAEKTFFGDGCLSLQFSGDYLEQVKAFIVKRKLGPGQSVLISLDDRESKSAKQNRTYRKFLQIAMQSKLFGEDYEHFHKCMKYTYGIIDYWEAPNGKIIATLRSTADYTMEQMAALISGIIKTIGLKFTECKYYDPEFDEMMKAFNCQEIKPAEEFELF